MAEFKNGKSGRGKKKLSFSMKQSVVRGKKITKIFTTGSVDGEVIQGVTEMPTAQFDKYVSQSKGGK